MKKVLIKVIKICGWIVVTVIILLILLIVAIQIPYVQNKVKDYAITFVQEKIGTPVQLDRIAISFPNTISIKGLYVESQQQDTLLMAQYAGVDINLFQLINNTVEIDGISLEGVKANVKRDSLQRFNFDYIIEAFASEEEKEETPSTMTIQLGQINLKNIDIAFNDDYDGHHLAFKLGNFVTRFKEFDLNKMDFSIPKIVVKEVKVDYHKQKAFGIREEVAVTENKESLALPKLNLGEILFQTIDVNYKDDDSALEAKVSFEEFLTSVELLDLVNQQIDIKELKLEESKAKVTFLRTQKAVTEKELPKKEEVEVETASTPWRVGVRNFNLKNVNVAYDNENEKKLLQGVDPNHIGIKDLTVALKDFQFSPTTITGNLEQFKFVERSGFTLKEFRSYFVYAEQTAFVKGFYLETPNTKLKSDIVLNYRDVNKLKEEIGDVSLDVNLRDSYLGLKDAYILMPDVFKSSSLAGFKNEEIRLEAKLKGTVENLVVDRFLLRGMKSTFMEVDGLIKGLPEVEKAVVNLNINSFQTTVQDIKSLAPKGTLPPSITIPSLIKLKGNVKGSMANIGSALQVKTSSGSMTLDARFDQRIKGKEAYSVNAKVVDLDVGRIIQNDSIGKISMQLNVKGTSLTPEKASAVAQFKIDKAVFNGYNYNNLLVNAEMDHGKYKLSSINKDPNLSFNIIADGQWSKNDLSLHMLADLSKIDVQQLHLVKDPTVLSGVLDVQMSNVMPDSLVGKIVLRDMCFNMGENTFDLKPIAIEAEAEKDYRKLALTSELLDFSMWGDYQLTTLGDAMTNSLATYFKREDKAKLLKNKERITLHKNQGFIYELKIKDNTVIQKFLPDLKTISTMSFMGRFDEERNFFSLIGDVPIIQYGDYELANIYIGLQPKEDKLIYSLGLDKVSNASIALSRLNLNGDIYDNTITYNLNIKDKDDKESYVIAGKVEADKTALLVSLDPNGFKLDHQNWEVNPNNQIVLNSKGFYVKDFELNLGKSFMKVNSKEEIANSPLKVQFNDFDIETLTKMVQKDKVLAAGSLNGELYLKDLATDFRFITDLSITDLEVMEMPLGNLDLVVENKTQSQFLAKMSLQGGENKVQLQGDIDADKQTMDLNIVLDKLQMKALEGFSMDNLSEAKGYLSGDIHVNGKFDDPKILGSIDFNKIGFHVNPINADFKDINEKIAFTSRGIEFDKFSITDSDGNLLVVDGQVLTKNYKDFVFNMDIKALDFKAISSTAKDNELYYGTLIFDTNIKIRGDLNKPVITGGIEIGKKTSFTVVMPQEDPSIAGREGIVEFVDQESLRLAELKRLEEDFNQTALSGLDATLSIKVDKEATFTMVMDKQSGDKVVIKGNGDLVGGIDASGKITLTGRYEFTEGAYDLSLNFMKRRFVVEPGSSIVWMGEPTSAMMNLTAIYETKTAPSDLLEGQLSGMSPTQQNMYKQKIPFQALLMMKGELLKPEISFDIRLKDGTTSVAGDVISNTKNRLDQIRTNETELNKQVFSLLLLNRFIGENPFESSAGGMSANAMARQSVSRLLSDQLNNIAGNLIAGVELNFNLDSSEDFSSGSRSNRTDLNVAVSKRLFADRLKVTVGSNFEVEGEQRQNEQATNIAGDIELEYALSKDGRYLMRVYRKNRYEVALQGQIVETGVGFVITMSYENFKELFERSRDKKQLKKQLKDESNKEQE
ncbi:MAG: translocation/assembly module TamB domain-containing protein [Flavobacteriaceae bacterium]|nr:translocation/assembly module TamB domain-containing protein [Flavobacteriaceae bacterium]